MIECSIIGCRELIPETGERRSDSEYAGWMGKWIVLRACQCGAWDSRTPKSCTCHSEGPVKIQYWPNLDWWMFGGVDEVILCPVHKREVLMEIIKQQVYDPTMSPVLEKPDPSNRH